MESYNEVDVFEISNVNTASAADIVGLADGSCGFAVRRGRNRVGQP